MSILYNCYNQAGHGRLLAWKTRRRRAARGASYTPIRLSVIFSISQGIGWEECLRSDLFCKEWNVKPSLKRFQ